MGQTWKVGAVAEASGLTVRTLHHWDEINLLSPSLRGPGGHREYTDEDLGQLYVVLALRGLGLSLERIRACLHTDLDATQVFRDHLTQLDVALRGLTQLRERVAKIVDASVDERDIGDPAELLRLLRDARPPASARASSYLTSDQRAALAEKADAVGPALPYFLEVEWPHLYHQAEALRDAGVDAGDPRVQRIIARLDELSELVGGGRSDAGTAVRRAWRDDPAAMSGESAETTATWPDLADFVEQARAIRCAEQAQSR